MRSSGRATDVNAGALHRQHRGDDVVACARQYTVQIKQERRAHVGKGYARPLARNDRALLTVRRELRRAADRHPAELVARGNGQRIRHVGDQRVERIHGAATGERGGERVAGRQIVVGVRVLQQAHDHPGHRAFLSDEYREGQRSFHHEMAPHPYGVAGRSLHRIEAHQRIDPQCVEILPDGADRNERATGAAVEHGGTALWHSAVRAPADIRALGVSAMPGQVKERRA